MIRLGVGIGVAGRYVDAVTPTLSTVEVGAVADNKIVLTYDENLDTGSVPATVDFSLVGSGLPVTISTVGVAGAAVTLTLSGDIYDFEIITLSYTAAANPIQDMAANAVANLVLQSITNNGNASFALAGQTLDYSDLSLTDVQVNAHIAGLSTGTNNVIDISGTNAHRTAASNDDLNTLLANGNTITLNDVLGAELHTSLNAANDSATQAITAFSDYSATIDGSTKVDSAIDFLDMIPQGAEEVTNGDFANWTGDDPDSWTVAGESGADPEISEVGSAEGHGGVGTGSCNIYTSAGTEVGIRQGSMTAGLYYVISVDITNSVSGTIKIGDRLDGTQQSAELSSVATHVFVFRATGPQWYIKRGSGVATDITIDNVSVKELQVLGSDLVTNGSFTLGSDLNVSNCVNDSYDTFANATPTGFDPISAGGSQRGGTADEISMVTGQKYVVTFDLALTSGELPDVSMRFGFGGATNADEESITAAAGANVLEFTAISSATCVARFANLNATNYQITNLSVKDADTDWTKGDGWIVHSGVASCDGSQGATSFLWQDIGVTATNAYLIKTTVSNYSAGFINVSPGFDVYGSNITANGTYTTLLLADTVTNSRFFIRADSAFIGDIDNVSVHQLTFSKEIAASTNYTGTHYVLPVDENDFIVPVDYTAESIVAQLFGGETNATTGWSSTIMSEFASQSTVVDTGEFCLKLVPGGNGGRVWVDLEAAPFSIITDDLVRIELRARHLGSGGAWVIRTDSASTLNSGVLNRVVAVGETTFFTLVYYMTYSAAERYFGFKEGSGTNDGGVYADNISVKKVTFPA